MTTHHPDSSPPPDLPASVRSLDDEIAALRHHVSDPPADAASSFAGPVVEGGPSASHMVLEDRR